MIKAKQLFDKIYSSLFLLIGGVVQYLQQDFMFVIALPYGSVMASRGSDYWGHVWIAFDKLECHTTGRSPRNYFQVGSVNLYISNHPP